MLSKDDYKSFVKENAPKSPMWRSLAAAFFVGGIICCIGEGVSDAIKAIFPDMTTEDVGAWTTVIMIFLGSLLTGLGVYDKLGHFCRWRFDNSDYGICELRRISCNGIQS